MPTQAGIVKSIEGKVVAIGNNGVKRELNAGDIVYLGESIVGQDAVSKIVISANNGKDIVMLGKDTLVLDQSVAVNEGFGNESAMANVEALQQALLNGTELQDLEATAAGGGGSGVASSDGVSLSQVSFTQGGHISNVTATYGDLGGASQSSQSSSAYQGSATRGATESASSQQSQSEPQLDPKRIEIPSSAYDAEISQTGAKAAVRTTNLDKSNEYFEALDSAVSGQLAAPYADFNTANTSSLFSSAIPGGYTVTKENKTVNSQTFEKAYLNYNTEEFDIQDGWYISKDKSVIIGSDQAKKLVVASETTDTSGYDPATTTIVKVSGAINPKIFGSDKADDITVDGAKVDMVSTGTGDDTITVKNGAEILNNVNSGSGDDKINIEGEHTTIQGSVFAGGGDDTINVSDKAVIKKAIFDGDGDDTINVKSGATVGDRDSSTAKDQYDAGVQLGTGNNKVVVDGADTSVSRITGYKFGEANGGGTLETKNDVTVQNKATVAFDIDIDSRDDQKVTVDDATVKGTIFTNSGDDKVFVKNGSKVGGILTEGGGDEIEITDSEIGGADSFYGVYVNRATGAVSDLSHNHQGVHADSYLGGAQNDYNKHGNDKITIKNSTVNGQIWGGRGDDEINIINSEVKKNVFGDADHRQNVTDGSVDGKDTINIANSTIGGVIYGEGGKDDITVNKSTIEGKSATNSQGNPIRVAIVGAEGDDTISVKNESNVKGNISGDQGGNTITVEGGSKVAGWVYGANAGMYSETGNNTITVTGENTEVSRVGDVSSGDSTITISNKAKVKSVHGDKGVDTITVDNATVAEKIEGGHGDDKIYVKNGARVEGYVTGDLDNDTIEVSGENTYVKEVKGDKGDDTITVEDKAKVFTIEGNDGVDTISAKSNATVGKIYGNGGADIISLEGGAKVTGFIMGDTKTMNDVHEKAYQATQGKNIDIVDTGAAADTITLSGSGTYAKNILGGDGDDIIKVKDGAQTKLIVADEGDDKITVSGAGTYVSGINGRGGNDTIVVEKGAKVDGIVGRWGDDKITVRGAGTVITGDVEGNEDSDTIKVLDGAKVEGSVRGGKGENPSVYGAAQNSDGNNITIENAEVKGNVEGSTYGGKNEINVSNSTIGGSVLGGIDIDVINVTSGSKVNKTVEGGAGEDKITVTGTGTVVGEGLTTPQLKVNGSITGGEGDDKIVLSDGAHAVNAGIAGWGGDDKITVTGSGTRAHSVSGHAGDDIIRVDNKAYIEHAVSANTGNGTVTVSGEGTSVGGIQSNGNAPITVEDGAEVRGALYAYGAGGEQTIVVQSGAKVNVINTAVDFRDDNDTGGNTEDTVIVKDAGTVVNAVRTGNHDDTLIVQDGATVGSVDLGTGNDTKMTTTNNNGNLVVNSLDGDGNIDLSKIAKVAETINSVDVSAVNNAVLNVDPKDVLDLGAQDKTLEIKGGSDDTVKSKSSGQWSADGSDATHKSFTSSANDDNNVAQTVTIKVENDVATDL